MVNSGASVPPEVPLPSEMDQETNFSTQSTSSAVPRQRCRQTIASMLS